MKNIYLYRFSCDELEKYYSSCGHKIRILDEKTQQFFLNEDIFLNGSATADEIKHLLSLKGVEKNNIFTVLNEISKKDCEIIAESGLSKAVKLENLLCHKDAVLCYKNQFPLTSDKILLFDSGDWPVPVISGILDAYNVDFRVINEYPELIRAMETEKDILVLLNLGGTDFDVNRFIKTAQIIPEIKQIPVIPFKNTRLGVGTSEISSGLNRIARVILSNAEVLSFLCVLLIKKDFHSAVFSSIEKLDIDENFSKNSLRQIYFRTGNDFFSLDHPYPQMNLNAISDQLTRINSVFQRIILFEWMTELTS
ncbi:MAG: hypothetical protein JW982_00580 [Spirochaetes bacterium]|nr:hypothetical protein [Spirochaetota bacterium]